MQSRSASPSTFACIPHHRFQKASLPSRRAAVPPETHVLELLLQSGHVQAIDVPSTRLTLAMQHQRAHVTEGLTTSRITTDERMEHTLVHPLLHLKDIDAAGADMGVHVKIHVKRRVPPHIKAAHQKCRLAEFAAAP